MLKEYAEVRLSPIEGYGVFAKKPIPKGTVWWKVESGEYITIDEVQFKNLILSENTPKIKDLIDTILTYSFYDEDIDRMIFCLDNGRYVNHSDNPNSKAYSLNDSYWSVTTKDIEENEEITEDYYVHFHCNWVRSCSQRISPNCW